MAAKGQMKIKLAPSYFIEGLLYNAPNWAFQTRYQETYCALANWMATANLERLTYQNGQSNLVGEHPEQWSATDATNFISHIATF